METVSPTHPLGLRSPLQQYVLVAGNPPVSWGQRSRPGTGASERGVFTALQPVPGFLRYGYGSTLPHQAKAPMSRRSWSVGHAYLIGELVDPWVGTGPAQCDIVMVLPHSGRTRSPARSQTITHHVGYVACRQVARAHRSTRRQLRSSHHQGGSISPRQFLVLGLRHQVGEVLGEDPGQPLELVEVPGLDTLGPAGGVDPVGDAGDGVLGDLEAVAVQPRPRPLVAVLLRPLLGGPGEVVVGRGDGRRRCSGRARRTPP